MLRKILSTLRGELIDQYQEIMARVDTATLKNLADMTHAIYLLKYPNLCVKRILEYV